MYSDYWYGNAWQSYQWNRRPWYGGSNYVNPWCSRPYPPGLTCYRLQGNETLWDHHRATEVKPRLKPL